MRFIQFLCDSIETPWPLIAGGIGFYDLSVPGPTGIRIGASGRDGAEGRVGEEGAA